MLTLIASWKLLVKSGEKGWKVLIPFYGDYVFYKQFYDKRLFWNLLVGYVATAIMAVAALCVYASKSVCYDYYGYYVCSNASIGVLGVLAIIFAVVTVVCNFTFFEMRMWYTAKAFNAKPIHCLAMIFAPVPAIILLGFDDKFKFKGNKRPFCIPKKEKKEEEQETAK